MTDTATSPILQLIRRVFDDSRMRSCPDTDLLRMFLVERDEAAFEALLRRHGPMVLHVCQGLLANETDAEDAFQATFLILARKASSIRQTVSLASWLHGVARRTALKAQTEFARRQKHQDRIPGRAAAEEADDLSWRDVRHVLHEELDRLPERLRAPLVLCYLQGMTQDQAAAELGLPKGTLKGRLERGRVLLRRGLVRRGLGPATLLAATAWPAAAVSAELVAATARAATGVAAARIDLLATGVLQTMFLTKVKMAAVVLVLAAAVGLCAYRSAGSSLRAPQRNEEALSQPAEAPPGQIVAPALKLPARPELVRAEPQQPGEKPTPPAQPEKPRPEDGDRERPEPPPPAEAIARLTTGLDSSGNATHIHPVPFSPDGQTLAWADRKDHAIRVWDVRTGKEQLKLHGHESHVLCVAYAPNGRTLASGSYDASTRIWDLITGRTRAVLRDGQRQSMVYTVAFSPDGKTLASGDFSGTIKLWDIATGKLLHTALGDGAVPGKQNSYVQVVVFSPDGKLLASAGQSGVVQMWDVPTGKERSELRRDLSSDEGRQRALCGVTSLAFSPDGKTLAAARYLGDPRIVLWDVATGKERAPIQSNRGAMTVTFSPDGKFLLSADREIRVWELASGQAVLTIPEPAKHSYAFYSASFSPDGKTLASGGQDNAVILWDAFGLGRDRRPPVLAAQDLQALWSDLTDSDAARAYRAVGALAAVHRQALPLIRERLRSIPAADPQRIRKLIADLDSDRFKVRETATEELEKLGELVEPALTKVLDGKPTLEVRRRVEPLLRKIVPEALRSARAVMVLEHVGNEEAQQVLKDLARGEPQAPLTRELRAVLERLARRATLAP